MNDLIHLCDFLTSALLSEPRGRLAYMASQFDPLCIGVRDPDDLNSNMQDAGDDMDANRQALLVARECFPTVYAAAVFMLHTGATECQLNRTLCEGFTQAGIPLEDTELVWYGIPMPAYGALLPENEFYEQYPDIEPVVRLFGVDLTETPPTIPDDSFRLAAVLSYSMEHYDDCPQHRQLRHVIEWLWGISGNSSVDYDADAMSEIELLPWNVENVTFARELISEAESIMADVHQGLGLLARSPSVLETLMRNFDIVQAAYQKTFVRKDRITNAQLREFAQHLRLEWAFANTGAD